MKAFIAILFMFSTTLAWSAVHKNFETIYDYLDPNDTGETPEIIIVDKAEQALVDAFDEVCDDSWCKSEFSGLNPLGLLCTIETEPKMIRNCTWSFGAVETTVEPNTGAISRKEKITHCPVLENVPLNDLMNYFKTLRKLGAKNTENSVSIAPLAVKAPGINKSMTDILNECLL